MLTLRAKQHHNGVAMKLSDYLAQHALSEGEFADRIGCSREAVRRYCIGSRIPDKARMTKIALATGCEVTANDFFGIAA